MDEKSSIDVTLFHGNAAIAVDHEASVYAVLRPAEFEKLVEAVANRVVEKLQKTMNEVPGGEGSRF